MGMHFGQEGCRWMDLWAHPRALYGGWIVWVFYHPYMCNSPNRVAVSCYGLGDFVNFDASLALVAMLALDVYHQKPTLGAWMWLVVEHLDLPRNMLPTQIQQDCIHIGHIPIELGIPHTHPIPKPTPTQVDNYPICHPIHPPSMGMSTQCYATSPSKHWRSPKQVTPPFH